MKHDPIYYAVTHGRGILATWVCYIIALISCIVQFDGQESIGMLITALMAFFGTWGMVELISWWYRVNWMEGAFKNYPVLMKMISMMHDVEEARGVAREISVMPTLKAHRLYTQWWDSVRSFWLVNSFCAVSFCLVSIFFV